MCWKGRGGLIPQARPLPSGGSGLMSGSYWFGGTERIRTIVPHRVKKWLFRFAKRSVINNCACERFVVSCKYGRFFFRPEAGKFNALTCWEFLQKLCALSTRRARRVVVITDNARYHRARLHRDWRQQKADRFRLDFLPPYSPELNPAERIWKLTRRLCIHNRYFRTLADVALAVEAEFAKWTKPNDTLRRLCAIT